MPEEPRETFVVQSLDRKYCGVGSQMFSNTSQSSPSHTNDPNVTPSSKHPSTVEHTLALGRARANHAEALAAMVNSMMGGELS
jgi:hypothetical protein